MCLLTHKSCCLGAIELCEAKHYYISISFSLVKSVLPVSTCLNVSVLCSIEPGVEVEVTIADI